MATTPATRTSAAPARVGNTNHKDLVIDKDGFNRGPWSVEERRVVYEYLNTWIQHHGLDAFVSKTWTKDEFVFLTNTINEMVVTNAAKDAVTTPRSTMAVRRQIHQLGQGRLGPLAKLARRSEALKRKIGLGDQVEDEERFPEMAIPVPKIVDGIYTIHVGRQKMASKSGGNKRGQEQVEGIETAEAPAAKGQNKVMVVKLSVDWARLHIRKDGRMEILEDGEVWESPL